MSQVTSQSKVALQKGFVKFKDFENKYLKFAQGIGINPNKNTKDLIVCIVIQLLLFYVPALDATLIIYEHLHGRGTFYKDFRSFTINTSVLCTAIPGIVLFINQHKLLEVLNWYKDITKESDSCKRQMKIIERLQRMQIWSPIWTSILAATSSVLLNKRQLLVSVYNADLVSEPLAKYAIIFTLFCMNSFSFWRLSLFSLGNLIIFVNFITKQYENLSKMVTNCLSTAEKGCQSEIGIKLNNIGTLHSELLYNLSIVSKLYEIPLILNEVLCVLALSVSITTFLFEPGETNSGISALMAVVFNFSYPVLGQWISSAAENFERAVYYCDWHNCSARNRKTLTMILLMASQPVGLSSGGYHLSNFMEISQIFRLSYNLVFFIKKRNERQMGKVDHVK